MRNLRLWAALLTTAIIALGGTYELLPSERSGEFKPERLWKLLTSPKFKTLRGKIQVTVFLPEGSRSWNMDLWADESRSRVQFELPSPTGWSQIITLNLPGEVWVLLPSAKRALKYEGSGFPTWRDMWQIRMDKLDMARNNYTLHLSGREKIAGHFCFVLRLEPKVKGNAIRKIWIHPPTRLPLQVERFSSEGELKIRVAFTEVKINEPLPVFIFEPHIPPGWRIQTISLQRQQVDVGRAEEILGFEPILPTWLPQGYVLEGIFALGGRGWKLAHIVYTDGITVISVFQHPASPGWKPPFTAPLRRRHPFDTPKRPPTKLFEQPPRNRPLTGDTFPVYRVFPQHVVVRHIGNLKVVLVSEVDKEWLERMADSMMQAAIER